MASWWLVLVGQHSSIVAISEGGSQNELHDAGCSHAHRKILKYGSKLTGPGREARDR